MLKPLITVLMAVNRIDEYFELAFNSILEQTLSKFEFIIVANAMTKTDYRNLEIYCARDARVILLSTVIPGLANALNYGLMNSKCDFIARMDADDISLKNRFEVQYKKICSDEKIVIVGCKSVLIDDFGKVTADYSFFESDASIRKVLPYRNPFIHPCLMMRKKYIIDVGGYKYGHMSEDHELFIRLSRDKNLIFCNVPEFLFKYRRHDNQITSIINSKKHFAEISGFLLTEFILTSNILYIFGILAIHPFVRKLRFHAKRNNFFKYFI